MQGNIHIGVIGSGDCSPEVYTTALELGSLIGQNGWVLVCGGLGGVMEGASKGCYEAGGMTVGILPGADRNSANPFIQLALPTGIGEARNVLVVRASDVVIALSGGYGTLSEIGFALRIGRPVIGIATWPHIPGIEYVETTKQAIECAKKYLK